MSTPSTIRDIVIVGGEICAWLVAAVLARRLKKSGVRVHIIEPAEDSVTPGAVITLPVAKLLHQQLGFSADTLISRCDAQVIFATCFSDWVHQGHEFCLGLSQCGSMINGVDFHHYLSRLHHLGETATLEDYSTAVRAARLAEGRSGVAIPIAGLDAAHSLNLHPAKYQKLLKNTAVKSGVQVMFGAPGELVRNPESGHVEAIVLSDGQSLDGDFFFDCSGPHGWLMGQLDAAWRSLPELAPFDCVTSGHQDRQPDGALNRVCWQANGWTRQIPLAGSATFEYQYPRERVSREDAERWILDHCPDCALSHRALRVGALETPWQSNCVAIGSAGGFAGDLLIPETQVWQKAISLWLDLYPDRSGDPVLARCYNRVMNMELDRVAEVHALLSCRAQSDGVWSALQPKTKPPASRRAQVFERIGRVAMGESEVLTAGAWAALLMGLGIWPTQYDPLADLVAPAELQQLLARISANSETAARDQLAGVQGGGKA